MIGIGILVVLALIYVGLPLWAKFIFLGINSFFPDPIPIIDEVLMIAATISDILRIGRVVSIIDWICLHKKVLICICMGIVALVITTVLLK